MGTSDRNQNTLLQEVLAPASGEGLKKWPNHHNLGHMGMERELISELRGNLTLIEDLTFRISFMTQEVSHFIKR